jgi:site-specific recombinase XerD
MAFGSLFDSLPPPDSSPVAVKPPGTLFTLQEEIEDAARFARAEKSEASRRAYKSDFTIFRAWCSARSLPFMPSTAAAVSTFIASEANGGLHPSTIGRRIAAIRYAHTLAGYEPPTNAESVRAVMAGIRRTVGVRVIKKDPATSEKVLAMVALAPSGRRGLRDRALLLLGFAGAFRRSELVALNVEDLRITEDGVKVFVARSKTDQEGEGVTIGVVRGSMACPVRAVEAWLAASRITEGALFRSVNKGGAVSKERLADKSVAMIVKRYAAKVGLKVEDFAGHSLRSGFLTSASQRGANIFRMMDVSRHKSVDTLRGYVREGEIFRNHAGQGLL